jgi:flagellar assembly protein FliH
VDNENQFKSWIIPEIGESDAESVEDNTLFGKPPSWYCEDEIHEEENVEDSPKPLTLDDIEEIRQSAYEDGFKEGKEAGFSQGLEEGTAQGVEEGIQKGTEQGLQEGLAAGQQQIDELISNWESLIERLHHPLEKLDENVEYQLVLLATGLAEQIARCEVQTNSQIILQALKQAVEALPISEQTLKILLHPDDLQFVQTAYSPEICEKRGWDLQGDPVLARGDCQIHTKTSSIDYAFSHRVEQVLKHFFKQNHQQLPDKNDDSNLLNEQPMTTKKIHVDSSEEINTEELSDKPEMNSDSSDTTDTTETVE